MFHFDWGYTDLDEHLVLMITLWQQSHNNNSEHDILIQTVDHVNIYSK